MKYTHLVPALLAFVVGGAGAQTLGLTDVTLGTSPGSGATELPLGHDVTFDVGGNAGEIALVALSFTPPIAPRPIVLGSPLEIDPFGFFLLFDGFTDPAAVIPAGGSASLAVGVPATLPVGLPVWLQAGLVDITGPSARLTNGLALVTTNEPTTTLAKGELSGHPLGATGGDVVVTDVVAWTAFWQLHDPATPAPAVDFTQDAVLAEFLGQQVIGGLTFCVDDVTYLGTGLQVDLSLLVPGTGCTTSIATQPFHFVTLPLPVASAVTTRNLTVSFSSCP